MCFKKQAFFLFSLLSVFLFSCDEKEKLVTSKVEIIRLDEEIINAKTPEELGAIFAKYNFYTKSLYRAAPDDESLISHVLNITSFPETKAFHQEIVSKNVDLVKLSDDLGKAFAKMKESYSAFVPPKIYTTFTGLENDLYVSDSVVIISIEAFGGPKAKYRPDQPEFILRRYEQAYIVPNVIRLLSESYIEQSQNTTLLNDMVYFGKTLDFTKEILPSTPDSLIIGYPDSSMVGAWYSQDLIWAYFIEKQLLYEQKPNIKEKYLGEKPFINEIGPACPGRIAQWLGWRIVQEFRTQNPEMTFQEVMKFKDPQDLLKQSKYRGLVDKE